MEGYGTGPLVVLPPEYINDTVDADAQGIDLDGDVVAAGDVAVYTVPFACSVLYAFCIVTETIAINGSTPNIKFDRRFTAGSDGSSRTDGTIANITIPDTTAAGVPVYDVAAQTMLTAAAAALLTTAATCRAGGGFWNANTSKCDPLPYGFLIPGNEVVVQVVATAGAGGGAEAGHFRPVLVVRQLLEVWGNIAAAVETA